MPDPRLDYAALLPGVGVFGGVRRFLELGNELVRRGHRYTLYHPDGTSPGWLPFAGATRRLESLRDAHHQVLLCGEPSLLGEFERARADLKVFYCVLEKLPGERSIVRHPGWLLLANSSGLCQRLRRRHGVRVEPAVGGIDLGTFRPAPEPRPERAEPLRILAYGRLSRRRKGTQLVVRAAERVAARLERRSPAAAGSAVRLVLFDHVGPGNEADPRAALRCRTPHEFHLDLDQAELAALYRRCDVFVSAERRAGWNNTVAEAMACGCPVVCTASGTRDLARHLDTAWVVRWRHPVFLAAGILGLVRQPATREGLRRRALQRVARFTWAHVADQVESAVRQRLEGIGDSSRPT